MKYLGNLDNLVRDADLAATNILASSAIQRTDDAAKAGGGVVALTGPYTGAANTDIDIEIVSDTITGTPRMSAPQFVGVGNSVMSAVTGAPGLSAQEFLVTLEDLGTETRKAYAPFQSVNLRAKSPGPGGNAITITIDASALVKVDSIYALQEALSANANNEFIGDHWNFGAATLNPDGTIPATAPRLVFGDDPQVYRAYRVYKNGRYVYGFSPAPVRDVQKGSRVRTVTGSRTVTIDDGMTPETLTNIATLYDCLNSIRTNSLLVEVDGAIVNDQRPNGMGATDLSVWTRSYVLSVVRDGGDAIANAELGLIVSATAPTEALRIRCTDASATNAERWEVRGDVSGRLADAITGVLYASTDYQFTVPTLPLAPGSNGASITVLLGLIDRAENEVIPSLCPVRPRLGVNARDGVYEFVYRRRPPAACDCETGTLTGGPDPFCLGLPPVSEDVMGLNDAQRWRLVRLDRWYRSISRLLRGAYDELDASNMPTDRRTRIASLAQNQRLFTAARNLLDESLRKIVGALDTATGGTWVLSTDYAYGAIVQPITANGYLYRAVSDGTSDATPPTWPTDIGETVDDDTVTWECFSRDALGAWDDVFAEIKAELMPYAMQPMQLWQASTAFNWRGDVITQETGADVDPYAILGERGSIAGFVVPTTANGHYYRLAKSSTPFSSGSSEPTWPTDGTTVADGDLVWQDAGAYWEADTKVAEGEIRTVWPGRVFECVKSGTTDSTEPDWSTAFHVVDGTAEWRMIVVAGRPAIVENYVDNFLVSLRSSVAEAQSIAGLTGNFNDAGTTGSQCWRDPGSKFWWVHEGDDPYLPIFTGYYYHSAKLRHDSDGNPVVESTQEFGFGPKIGCENALKEGDKIIIAISGTGNGRGYQQGDNFQVLVNHAEPLPLGGGQTGDDKLTWSVVGSVDGRLDDYELVTTMAPPTYADGGLGFVITPSAIRNALGDQYRFSAEGGQFKWRQDGGAWSADTDIDASVALIDGLEATFTGGRAPSWVSGDAWSFHVEAVHGVDQVRQPTEPRMTWETSTVLDIAPVDTMAPVSAILIADHTIPDTATIRLQGSDDSFATTPLDITLTWRERSIYHVLASPATYAEYRLSVDTDGSIQWLWLGDPLQPKIRTGAIEQGSITKRYRMPSFNRRGGLSIEATHTWLTQASADSLREMIEHACSFDDKRFALVPNDAEGEVALVEFDDDELEFTDQQRYQPRDTGKRRIDTTLKLRAIP